MAKYEINLLIDGNLSKEESDTIANNLISSSFKKTKNFKDEYFGHIKLAYKIKKKIMHIFMYMNLKLLLVMKYMNLDVYVILTKTY